MTQRAWTQGPCGLVCWWLGRIIVLPRNLFQRLCLTLLTVATACVLSGAADAQTKLEARYTASLAGIPLGNGSWVIDIGADQYTAVATGRTSGLIKLISDGSGTTGSRGTLQGVNIAS